MSYQKEAKLLLGDGPSRNELFLAFQTVYAKEPERPSLVKFSFSPGQKSPFLGEDVDTTDLTYAFASIEKLIYDGDSGDKFMCSGFLFHDDKQELAALSAEWKFNALFDTARHEGCMTIHRVTSNGE